MKSFRTRLARARGFAPSHTGTDHWFTQCLTSLALLPIGLWFVFSFVSRVAMHGGNREAALAWLQSPFNVAMLILLLAVGFHHGASGLQVISEDYIHVKKLRVAVIILVQFLAAFLAVVGVLAVLKIFLGA